jgi:hypothetical protein
MPSPTGSHASDDETWARKQPANRRHRMLRENAAPAAAPESALSFA